MDSLKILNLRVAANVIKVVKLVLVQLLMNV